MGWHTRGAIALILLLMAAAAPASAAIRTDGATVRSKGVFLVNGGSGKVSVSCPLGQRALAAGVRWRTASGPTSAIGRTVTALLPKQGGRSWVAAGINANVDASLVLIVRCLPEGRIGTIRTIVQDTPLILSTQADGYVACEPGEHVVSGGAGIMVSGPPIVPAVGIGRIGASAPVDSRTWIGNGGGALGSILRTVGLCASSAIVGEPPLLSLTITADQAITTGTLTCPTGKGVLAGGLFWTNALGGIITSKPLGTSRPTADGRGWTVSVWGDSGSAARVVVMAFCSRL